MGFEERRQYARVEAPMRVRLPSPGGFTDEYVGNISKNGVFIKALRSLPVNSKLEMILVLPYESREVAIQAELVRFDYDTPGMGMHYIKVEPRQEKELSSFIDRLLDIRGGDSRRLHPRIHYQVEIAKIMMDLKEIKDLESSFIQNISQGGIYIETDKNFLLNQPVEIALVNPETRETINIQGKVVNIRRSLRGEEGLTGIGIEFNQFTEEKEESINRFIKKLVLSK